MTESFINSKAEDTQKNLYQQDTFIHFNMSDPGGIMFYEKVFDLAHQCLENFVRNSNLGWNSWFANTLWAVPIVHCEASYKKPILCGESAKVLIFLKDRSDHSLSFYYHIHQRDQLCSIVETTHVFIDKVKYKKIPVPSEVLNLILK